MRTESSKLEFIIHHLAFIIVFGIYLYTLCPTVSVGDSGEFITAASTLSLAHPPAYPLYSLLGKVFTFFFPFGNYAYRMNLMSTFFAVLTILLIYLVGYRLWVTGNGGISPFPIPYTLFPVLILAFAPVFWLQGLVSEVFTLNTFFAVLLIFVCITSSLHRSLTLRLFYLFSFLFGLGLGNHHTLVLFSPGFAYFWWTKRKEVTLRSSLFALCFFLLGFSIYLYLPIRSINNPPLDWGNPETFKAFWRVLSRADYGSLRLMLETGEKKLSFLAILSRFFFGLKENYTLLGLILSFLGLFFLAYKERDKFVFLFLLFFFSGPFFIVFSNLPDSAESWGVIERFYILPLVVLTICFIYGFNYLIQKYYRYRAVLYLLFLSIPVILLLKSLPLVNRRNFYFAYDYGKNNFRTLAPNSYFIMDGGDDTFFTTAYLKYVERKRKDVRPFDRGGLIFAHPYGKDFRQLTREEKNIRREEVEKSLVNLNQPVYYSTMNEKILPGFKLSQNGILYKVESREQRGESKTINLWEFYNLRNIPQDSLKEYRVRALAPIYAYLNGVEKQKKGDLQGALKEWNYAYSLGKDVKWLKSNLIYTLTELGIKYYYEKNYLYAEECFLRALKIDPLYSLGYTNLGVIQEAKGENEKAKESYLEAIRIDPQAVDAYYNLAVIYWKEANWQKVVELLEKVLAINPQHEQARKYLEQAKLRMK